MVRSGGDLEVPGGGGTIVRVPVSVPDGTVLGLPRARSGGLGGEDSSRAQVGPGQHCKGVLGEMGKRRLGALIGAAVLTFAAVGSVAATKPTYAIDVTKVADPTSVPAGGGDVNFTITVTNTGSGDFHTVTPVDSDGGCSLAGPTGDTGSDGILSADEVWTWTCTVTDFQPNTSNTVNVHACHNSSDPCNSDNQNATGSAEVEVGLCEADCATAQPPTEQPPTPEPSSGGGGATTLPSQAPTDTAGSRTPGPGDGAWLLVVALGVLLASIVVLRPAKAGTHRS